MACDSSYLSGLDTIALHKYEDALCSACRALEDAGIPIPPAARPLWNEHKNRDAERVASENADEERRKLKAEGLSKLTAKERDALGLRGE